jgi:hypothetical protein
MTRLPGEVRCVDEVVLERGVHERRVRSAGGGGPAAPVRLGDQVAGAILPQVVEEEGDHALLGGITRALDASRPVIDGKSR